MQSDRINHMQRAIIPDHILPALLFMDGLVSIAFAIFAHAMGFDPNPDWGRSRFILLFIGLFLVAISLFLFQKKPFFITSEILKSAILLAHLWAIIVAVYAWFITFGTFTEWRASTRYYTLLADAFGKGQLHVDVEPGAALLAADDPYSSEGRPGFEDEVWDLSLYQGKLYLYWGPVPALLLTPIQRFIQQPIADIYLVFLFLCGLLIVNSLFILKVWRSFFPDIAVWHVILSIFLIGLILPILWSLNIPDVYEAAIGAGQFFLVGGIYFAVLAFKQDIRKRFLFLAGFFWACSVGSRAINVLPIFFLTALTLFWIWKKQPKPLQWMKITRFAAALIAPLALGALLIGWYNWARFDSPFEFGLRYQITIYNLNRDMPLTFQLDYLPFNFVAYLLQPFEFITKFPFIQPVEFSELLSSLGINAPKLYAAGRVTGILFYAPILLFAFIPFLKKDGEKNGQSELKLYILYLLSGSFLISFITLLCYFYGQMRFMLDMISQVTLLAIMGYWSLARKSKPSKALLITANFLIIITLATSLLLAFTSESSRMERLNPELMDRLNSFFVR